MLPLEEQRRRWLSKPALRLLYRDFQRRMAGACRPGRTLEIGSGSGWAKDVLPDVVATDVQPMPWLDVVADAEALPFAEASFDTIVMMDVLHHLPHPLRFLSEAARVLKPGGRLVMLEPGITPVSRFFYSRFHDEPVRLEADAFGPGPQCDPRDPFDANQAIPTLLLDRGRARLAEELPALRLTAFTWLSMFAYPLSGGFQSWSLIPAGLVGPVLWLEDRLMPLLGRLMAFRLLAVMERR